MLRVVTTADTEILATASAVQRLPADFPDVRCANPAGAPDAEALVEEILDGARVVLCRILGGRRGWPDGFDLLRERCRQRGVALLALGATIGVCTRPYAGWFLVSACVLLLLHAAFRSVHRPLRAMPALSAVGWMAAHDVAELPSGRACH